MLHFLKHSLSFRIVVNILTFCTLLFIICLGTFYFFSKNTIQEKTVENAIEIGQKTVLEAEKVLFSTETIIDNYMWMLEEKPLNADSICSLTEIITRANPFILGCAVAFEPDFFPEKGKYFAPYSVRKNGTIESFQLGHPDYEYFIMDWYQIPKFIETDYWSEPYFDEGGSNEIITSYSRPFYRNTLQGKQFAGTITIDLSLEWFTELISQVKILETGYATVITQHGSFVINPNEDLIMHETIFSYAKEINIPGLRAIGRDMLAGNTNFADCTLRGEKMQLYYTPLPTSKWALIVVFPEAEMYASLRKISLILIGLTVLGLSLLISIVSRIVKKQVKPLRQFANSARAIAGGDFNNPLPSVESEDEMKDLHDSFAYMQSELTNYIENLKDTTAAKEKIESELRIAREIQMGMIPKIFPPFPDTPEIDLFAVLEPAKEVGGDLYDFFLIDDEHLCFAIGDVSGKGVPASLFMAVTRTLLRSTAPNQLSTATIVNTLNASLAAGNDSSMFVTFFIGIVNLKTGKMTYTNAGHNPPVVIHKDQKPEYFETTTMIPIGLFDSYPYVEKTKTLQPGDIMFLYTDGITEAENRQKELYSDERLITQLIKAPAREPKALVEFIKKDICAHVKDNMQSDDITMLSLIYFGHKE